MRSTAVRSKMQVEHTCGNAPCVRSPAQHTQKSSPSLSRASRSANTPCRTDTKRTKTPQDSRGHTIAPVKGTHVEGGSNKINAAQPFEAENNHTHLTRNDIHRQVPLRVLLLASKTRRPTSAEEAAIGVSRQAGPGGIQTEMVKVNQRKGAGILL